MYIVHVMMKINIEIEIFKNLRREVINSDTRTRHNALLDKFRRSGVTDLSLNLDYLK